MKRLLFAMALLLAAQEANAARDWVLYALRVQDLPNSCRKTHPYWIYDGAHGTDCTTGGGSNFVICECDNAGTSYVASNARAAMQLLSSGAPVACAPSTGGTFYYDAAIGEPCFCDGSNYVKFSDAVTTCSSTGDKVAREDSYYILREDGDKILRE